MNAKIVKFGEIYATDIDTYREGTRVQQGKNRPCIIISNDKNNDNSPVVTMIPLTSKQTKAKLPTHVKVGKETGISINSIALCECIRTIDKKNLKGQMGKCGMDLMVKICEATGIQINMPEIERYKAKQQTKIDFRKISILKDRIKRVQREIEMLKDSELNYDDELEQRGMLKQELKHYLESKHKSHLFNKIINECGIKKSVGHNKRNIKIG